jgi:hypothetical protein
MVDRAERDPTMEEIVVALRETRQAAGRAVPFAVVNGQREVDQAPAGAPDARNARVGATDITDLRDSEIQRLLAENAQLNQRVVSLLKVLEHEQARNVTYRAPEAGHNAVSREVKAALETELRPVLGVLLRLLETLRGGTPTRRPSPPSTGSHHDTGIIDLDAPRAHE